MLVYLHCRMACDGLHICIGYDGFFSMNVSGMKCVGWIHVQMIYVWRNSLRLEAVWYTYNSTAAVGYS